MDFARYLNLSNVERVYAKSRIHPAEWDAYNPLGF